MKQSPLLPMAWIALRILIVLNGLLGVGIGVLLVAMFQEPWIMSAFQIAGWPDAHQVIVGMRAIAVLGLVTIPLNHVVLKRLRAIVGTVRAGDPFVVANAAHLLAIAWALLALQLLSLVIGGVGKAISTPAHPIHLDAGFSTGGWLAVLMAFILARIFATGAQMRDDLKGTV